MHHNRISADILAKIQTGASAEIDAYLAERNPRNLSRAVGAIQTATGFTERRARAFLRRRAPLNIGGGIEHD